MNINFFVKKEVNVLPYIAGGIFALLLLVLGVYFYLTHTLYANNIEDDKRWIEQNAAEVAQAREISQLDQLANQAESVQGMLLAEEFPMAVLAEDLATLIPNENARVSSFQISDNHQVTLLLENTETTMGREIVDNFEEQPYVQQVQFLHAQNETPDEDVMRFELIVDLAPSALEEVGAE